MTITEIRKILRDTYGARQYRITWNGEIHVYGQFPNTNLEGWRFWGAVGDYRTMTELRYLSGETRLYWISADRQSSLYMGKFPSEKEARAAIPHALDDLIAVGSADDEAALRAGTWSIE